MAAYDRITTVRTMKSTGIVPVFYDGDTEICKKMVAACYDGGARVFEFTNRGDNAQAIFEDLIYYVKQELKDMILGIGSVIDPATTALYLQLGANFIVSPIVNKDMAKICNRRKVAWIPGCGSVTEISYAEELGAEMVKIFPGSSIGGPSFVKAVKGPLPWTSIMATGGVSLDQEGLLPWFEAGVNCIGAGSNLFCRDGNGAYDFGAITDLLKKSRDLIFHH
ncbi:MAG: bifunctional 4-hydroxy-2-oxoglutarate aldolase/2-dehydro-3-deoxy-phosphogluconate aldolase [Sediminicola sp.]